MNMSFHRKLPIPKDVKAEFPVTEEMALIKYQRDAEIRKIFEGRSDKFILIIGPCSADNRDAVLDYMGRLRIVQDKISDKILIIPRVYTNKPRTTCDGYKGMLHQPDPTDKPDMYKGIVATREMHMSVLKDYGFTCADEMLYPENHRYVSDLLSYVSVGARSVQNQHHRLTASGLDIPVGMKNPTDGDITVMLNSVRASQHSHTFIYRGWEVESKGNLYTHAILRGYTDNSGKCIPNYRYENLLDINEKYIATGLQNPAIIVDTNHANSAKNYLEQPDIAHDVLKSRSINNDIKKLVKGLMIESYIEDGTQYVGENIYGKSITDPCLGWDKTEKLIFELADKL